MEKGNLQSKFSFDANRTKRALRCLCKKNLFSLNRSSLLAHCAERRRVWMKFLKQIFCTPATRHSNLGNALLIHWVRATIFRARCQRQAAKSRLLFIYISDPHARARTKRSEGWEHNLSNGWFGTLPNCLRRMPPTLFYMHTLRQITIEWPNLGINGVKTQPTSENEMGQK